MKRVRQTAVFCGFARWVVVIFLLLPPGFAFAKRLKLPEPRQRPPAPLSVRQILGPPPALRGQPKRHAWTKSRSKMMMRRCYIAACRDNTKKLLKQVRKDKSGVYFIPKALVEYYTRCLHKLGAQATVVPYFQKGDCVGFRLVKIKPGSVFSLVGILPGDTVLTINGFGFTSPKRALEAYSALINATKWSLLILRKGNTFKLLYRLTTPKKAPASRIALPTRRR